MKIGWEMNLESLVLQATAIPIGGLQTLNFCAQSYATLKEDNLVVRFFYKMLASILVIHLERGNPFGEFFSLTYLKNQTPNHLSTKLNWSQ